MEKYKIELYGIEYEIIKDDDGKFIKPDFLLDIEPMGSAMKPAHEPIVLARKPLSEKSIAENVLKHGTGGINIDGSRIGTTGGETHKGGFQNEYVNGKVDYENGKGVETEIKNQGRFPANIIFDEEAGKLLDEQSGISKSTPSKGHHRKNNTTGDNRTPKAAGMFGDGNWLEGSKHNDSGGASRFFYCPKTSKKDRNEGIEITNQHPTVKPTDLMRYLINLVTPKGGTTLDPFMGSGSTGKAAVRCGVNFIGIEKEEEYMKIAVARINHERNKPRQQELF